MATTLNAVTDIRTEQDSPASGARASMGRRSLKFGAAVLGVASLATVSVLAVGGAGGPGARADAAVLTNCAVSPSSCGYPDATNSGVPSGMALKSVPSQVSSGPGWYYSAAGNDVIVNVKGTVISGLYIPYNLVINASNVTVNDVQVVTNAAFGISLTHTTGVTIENSTISGLNANAGRVGSAIDDVYADSTGITVLNNNISNFKTGIQMTTGLVQGNYIHDPGYTAGDHTNGISAVGTAQPMTITGNTICNNLGQTDDITLNASTSGVNVANKTVTNNFLAGGSYSIYGGNAFSDPTSNIKIQDNRFGQLYYAKGGQYGPAAYFDHTGTGNVWSGNVWDTTGQAIPSP